MAPVGDSDEGLFHGSLPMIGEGKVEQGTKVTRRANKIV